ncbi:MAG: hypothetical protein M3P26_15395 [Gemmatimonadota bacterium]|nr:hypothetical protein [Gemmatimonadota bacterium]
MGNPPYTHTWADARKTLRYLDLPITLEEVEPAAREELADALQQLEDWTPKEARACLRLDSDLSKSFMKSIGDDAWWTSRARPLESKLLVAVMLGFVAIAVAILGNALFVALTSSDTFAVRITRLLDDGLLMFIVLEIVETVRQQVTARERLYRNLVRNFLVIGIVSGIRHLLAVGAQITLGYPVPYPTTLAARRSLMIELAVSSGVVILLVIGWKLSGGTEFDDPLERWRKKS